MYLCISGRAWSQLLVILNTVFLTLLSLFLNATVPGEGGEGGGARCGGGSGVYPKPSIPMILDNQPFQQVSVSGTAQGLREGEPEKQVR